MFCAARDPAYKLAAETLQETAEIQISARHLRNLAVQIGGELESARDAKTEAYFQQPLPRVPTTPSTPIALACVSVDGGRTQTRLDGGPNGVQEPHWRETKNAVFMRMTGVQFDVDPHPELPECFRDRKYMKKLLSGVVDEEREFHRYREVGLEVLASRTVVPHLPQFALRQRFIRPHDGGRSGFARVLYRSEKCLRR